MLRYILGRYKEPIKKFYIRYRKVLMMFYLPLLRMGSRKKCYVCGKTLGHFTTFKGGLAYFPEWIVKLDIIGSDVDNFGCPHCNSFDRERHLFMYFDKLNLWSVMKSGHILHFAPEPHLSRKMAEQQPAQYIKGDLFPANDSIRKIDATAIDLPTSTFDLVLANHMMEHIPDYKKALSEIFRVLKPGGIAVLQTPFSKILRNNFEDEGIDNEDLRLFFYAQRDHVRVFSEAQFMLALQETGFELAVVKHSDFFSDHDAFYYGVNRREDLIRIMKPKVIA